MNRRLEKINNLVREVLAELILKEFCTSRDIIISLTHVETSEDLNEANIFISTIPNEKRKSVVETLNKEAYFFQGMLNKILRMRPVPRIKFSEDVQPVQAEEVEKILENLKKD